MPAAASALFYLWSRTLMNLVLSRLRRLKQPKYLFGAVLALAYLYFLFIYPTLVMERTDAERAAAVPEELVTWLALAMLAFCALSWVWWRKRMVLQMTDAEIAFFLSGPISHAALVHYHLVRGQASMLVSALIFTLLSQNWESFESPLSTRFAGWWLSMAAFYLYVTASGFTLTRLRNRGIPQWLRQLAMLVLLVFGVWIINLLDPHLRLPTLAETTPPAFGAYLRDQSGSGALYWMVLPFRALLAPLFASDIAAFLRALGPALIILTLLYVWAFVSAAPDPEGAMDAAAKRASLIAAFRKGNLRPAQALKARADPFRLRAHGSPIVAFLWKNLLSTREYFRPQTLLGVAALLLVWDWWQQSPPRYPLAAALVTMIALFTALQVLLLGAQLARQDLRADMEHADLIKTWPVAGWQVVLGELLAPVFILTGILWLCLLQIGLSIESPRVEWLTPQLRLTAGLALGVLLPFLLGVQLFVANAVVVLFGGWIKIQGAQQQGFEVGLQRMVFFVAQFVAMTFALLPGLLFGTLVYIPLSWLFDVYAMLPAALVAALVLAGELAWGINWLGERFDAHDLSG